jgi:Fe-S-cluster formation regulator IscX/YfhJ
MRQPLSLGLVLSMFFSTHAAAQEDASAVVNKAVAFIETNAPPRTLDERTELAAAFHGCSLTYQKLADKLRQEKASTSEQFQFAVSVYAEIGDKVALDYETVDFQKVKFIALTRSVLFLKLFNDGADDRARAMMKDCQNLPRDPETIRKAMKGRTE